MNISFEQPYAFFALAALFPLWLMSFYRTKKLLNFFPVDYKNSDSTSLSSFRRFKRSRIIRIVCNSLAWICMVFAFAGISWGTNLVPVQKSGNAVCLVFDISYSMLTKDAPGGLSRLEGAKSYASKLLERLESSNFSLVLAKGDGLILIPQTEDLDSVAIALNNLSPAMMTSAGSSLGKGLRAASRSFSSNFANFKNILVFTDGDETDGLFTAALTDSLRANIPVTVIGFGSERESEVLAGDGKTLVKTALRSEKIKESIGLALKKSGIGRTSGNSVFAQYVDASQAGSALKILHSIKRDLPSASGSVSTTSMEIQRVARRGIFLFIALVLMCTGILFSEFDLASFLSKQKIRKNSKAAAILIVFSLTAFSSCSQKFNDGKKILQSSWAWHQQNYKKATAGFFQILENPESNATVSAQYAVYGLASTYMMQKEYEAAVEKFNMIAKDAPEGIRYSAAYNLGIIAYQKGNYEDAEEYFHQALLIKPGSLDAKVNLELSCRQLDQKSVKQSEQSSTSVSQSKDDKSSVSDAIFSQIYENEENQWKSQPAQQSDNSVLDY